MAGLLSNLLPWLTQRAEAKKRELRAGLLNPQEWKASLGELTSPEMAASIKQEIGKPKDMQQLAETAMDLNPISGLLGVIKNQKMYKDALDHFGKTHVFSETGYILDDGTRLDLSGRHYASGYHKTPSGSYIPNHGEPDYLRGNRAVDHREVYDVAGQGGTEGMLNFMDQTGALRYMPRSGITALTSNMPSDTQIARAVGDFRALREPMYVDVTNPITGNTVASEEFERPTVDLITEFIRKYQK